MNTPETILVPFVDCKTSTVYECRPHKLVFHDSYLEYFQWHKTNDLDENTEIRQDFFIDLTVCFKRSSVTGLSYGYINKDELYVLEISDRAGSVKVRFNEKSEARFIYEKIKTWWLNANS